MDTVGKAPGVYVQPIDAVGPIVGVGTSTVAMIGRVRNLATGLTKGEPQAVTSWTVYTSLFGGFGTDLPLPYAVRGFFENGGSFLYVIPVDSTADLTAPIDQLTRLPDVNIVCAPGETGVEQQKALIAHCIEARNRFAVLDGFHQVAGATPAPAEHAGDVPDGDAPDGDAPDGDAPDGNAPDGNAPATVSTSPVAPSSTLLTTTASLSASEFAAVYWPWLVVDDPAAATGSTDRTVTVPASGHIAGIMARSDARYGVHKAPANEEVRGALDLAFTVNGTEQGRLNDAKINVVRRFSGRPPILWGARTLSAEPAWRYVNVRRLVSYVEESLTTGLGWALFEANTTSLWKSLERTVTEFLDRVWQAGALFGRTAGEAYYVRIDEELNPAQARQQGQVYIEIGIAPVAPAEFVIVRLGLLDGSQSGVG